MSLVFRDLSLEKWPQQLPPPPPPPLQTDFAKSLKIWAKGKNKRSESFLETID